MKSRVIGILLVVIVALLYLLFRGLFINIERRSVYSGPWSCGHNADLGPFRVEVHPAARSDREPYGSPAIRGFRVGLSFNKKKSTNTELSVVKAIYTYAPLNKEYEKARHPMTVLEATRQPGSINQAYTVFLQPDDHLDDKKFVREGRYKLQIDLDCEGKEASLVAEVNLEYRRKVAVFGSPLIYLWHNLKAK
jgi:hypothetical protein